MIFCCQGFSLGVLCEEVLTLLVRGPVRQV
jgi:hypothetical protein